MKIFLLIIAVLIILFVFVRYLEQKSLYYPFRDIEITPKDIGLDFENVNITTDDGVDIHGWFIPAIDHAGVILFSHGNGGNISHRLEKLQMLNKLNLDILIYDYRGYGMSKGRPSESGLYLDADAMYAYLLKEKGYTPEKIIAYGESLGASVAVELASRRELKGLILEGSFSSVKDIAQHYFPFIPSFMIKTKFDSINRIKEIAFPKLIMHSIDDEVIPFKYGETLFKSAADPKNFVKLSGGHNDSFLISRDLYLHAINAFISDN